MSRWNRALVVVAAAAALAAVTSIAGARSRSSTDTPEAARLAALSMMDEAIAQNDVATAVHAWRQARELALRTRGWQAPLEAAVAEHRLAAQTTVATPSARELYLVALFRARAEGSVDGALGAAEGFARLGDRDAARVALRIASRLAARSGDPEAATRVLSATERLLRRTADWGVPTIPRS